MDEENTERAIFTLENRIDLLEGKLTSHRHHRDPTWDLWLRNVDRIGRATYTDHFRSGIIPAGFAWIADGTFNGAPAGANLDYSYRDTYLAVVPDATPHFLADAITVYADKSFYARLGTARNIEIGVRLDDGSDDNYAEVILDGQDDGTYVVDFRFRAGGGAVNDVAGPRYPCSEMVVVQLYWYSPALAVYGYMCTESGDKCNITGFNTGALAWTPARVGIKVQIAGGNRSYCDWFYSTFS